MDQIEKWLVEQANFEPDPTPGGMGIMAAKARNEGVLVVASRWHDLSVTERAALIGEWYAAEPPSLQGMHRTVTTLAMTVDLYVAHVENLIERVADLEAK